MPEVCVGWSSWHAFLRDMAQVIEAEYCIAEGEAMLGLSDWIMAHEAIRERMSTSPIRIHVPLSLRGSDEAERRHS